MQSVLLEQAPETDAAGVVTPRLHSIGRAISPERASPIEPILAGFPTPPAPPSSTHTFPAYRIALYDIDGGEIDALIPYIAGSLKHVRTLNEPDTIEFACAVDEITQGLLAPGSREVHVFRDDELVAAGDLLVGTYQSGDRVQFVAKGFARRLYRRLISETLEYHSDLISIAWSLINWTNSDYPTGITRHPDSTALPPRPGDTMQRHFRSDWWEFNIIGEILDQFVERPKGFDWEVTKDKEWLAFHNRQGDILDPALYSFERGKNIVEPFSYTLDATETTSRLWVIGFGDGRNTRYKFHEDGSDIAQYGLLESTYSRTGRGWVRYLQGVANRKYDKAFRDVRSTPVLKLTTEDPAYGTFDKGDRVQVTYERGWAQINGLYRIMSKATQQSESGAEITDLILDPRLIDVPEDDPDGDTDEET